MGVGKERGGGHTVRAREGEQWGQGPRSCSREGARRGWPTDLRALYYDLLILKYHTDFTMGLMSVNVEALITACIRGLNMLYYVSELFVTRWCICHAAEGGKLDVQTILPKRLKWQRIAQDDADKQQPACTTQTRQWPSGSCATEYSGYVNTRRFNDVM